MVLTLATPRPRAELKARARAEFLEMPGLCLTLSQASRLCCASPEDCQRVFDEMITDGFLSRIRDVYVRTDTGWRCRGDGPGAGVMKPPPRDHTDRVYMSTLTDEDLAKVIQIGGAMKGKPLMPGNPQIKAMI